MDPPLRGSTAMSHNACTIREPIEPQEASPMQHEMHVLGIDGAKRVLHAVGMDDRGKIVSLNLSLFVAAQNPAK